MTNPLQTHTQVQPAETNPNPNPWTDAAHTGSTLIDQVVALCTAQGMRQEKIELMLSDNMIARAQGGSLADQRCTLNVFWQVQLGQFGRTTFRERFSLISEGTEADWLKLFKQFVLPFIIDKDLPVALS